MYLFGFDVTEWAALITVIAGFISAIFYGFKKLVTDPAIQLINISKTIWNNMM